LGGRKLKRLLKRFCLARNIRTIARLADFANFRKIEPSQRVSGCQRAERCGGHPMCHRCATARRPRFPSAKSLIIPIVSLPVQSAAQGEHRRSGSCSTPDRRSQGRMRGGIGSSVGGSRTSAEDLGCPVYTNERRTHDSYAQIPRVGSKRPWPAASVGFTKDGLGS
jgi:hypothetical protein